jgi:hypothetical protein
MPSCMLALTEPSSGPERWSLSVASILPSSRWCWSPTNRSHWRGAPCTPECATLAPPKKRIAIEWPDAIRVDGRLVGGGRLGWPEGADEAEPPPWLVFCAVIRTASMAGDGAGPSPLTTALEDEGFEDVGSDRLVESFARHFMREVDHWRNAGFIAIANNYVSYLERRAGVCHDIGDDGELLVTRVGRPVEHHWPGPKLAAPSWLDPHSGGPRE